MHLDGVVALLGVVGQDLVDFAPDEPRLHCDLAAVALRHAGHHGTSGFRAKDEIHSWQRRSASMNGPAQPAGAALMRAAQVTVTLGFRA